MGLLELIDDLEHATMNPSKNATACHLLTQEVVDGVASSVFSGPEFLNDGHSTWRTLMEEYE